jgi:hypothetical protein
MGGQTEKRWVDKKEIPRNSKDKTRVEMLHRCNTLKLSLFVKWGNCGEVSNRLSLLALAIIVGL